MGHRVIRLVVLAAGGLGVFGNEKVRGCGSNLKWTQGGGLDIVPGLAGGPRSPGAPPVCFGLFRGRPGLDIQAGVAARVKVFVAPAPGPKDHLHTIIGSTCTRRAVYMARARINVNTTSLQGPPTPCPNQSKATRQKCFIEDIPQ